MPKTLQEIIDHADDMSTAFDDYRPEASTLRDPAPLLRARAAVHARARAEAEVAAAVAEMRDTGYSWAAIGMVLGTTGEAARQRYGRCTNGIRSRPPRG
jgi:predicted lipoprotein